jgi:hypothetical protein
VPDDGTGQPAPTQTTTDLEDTFQSLGLDGAAVVAAGWRGGLRDLWLDLSNGRRLIFRDCLQFGFHRSLDLGQPLAIGGWWIDEPSPLLQSLPLQVRLLYHHIVLEVGDGLLRVACRRVDETAADFGV